MYVAFRLAENVRFHLEISFGSATFAYHGNVSNKLMINILLNLILLINTSTTSSIKPRLFPSFDYVSSNSIRITNEVFKTKNSIVVLGHIGCPAFMQFIKDTQETNVMEQYQLIYLLENTNDQISQFNSNEENPWSTTRKYFELMPLKDIVVGECSSENIKTDDKDIVIEKQCRKISKKLKTKYSPSFYFVNTKGEIIKSFKGYFYGLTSQDRLSKLINE